VTPSAPDHGGTVYPVPVSPGLTKYSNVDGGRIDDGRYTNFKAEVGKLIPEERLYTDPVKTFAYGTDASFYRLLPQIVVKVHNENEVKEILPMAAKHETPVTFRAAGTSLSGQAVTDSILLKLSHTGKNFRNYDIKVRVDPARGPVLDVTKHPRHRSRSRTPHPTTRFFLPIDVARARTFSSAPI
jgi:hypothetical protein